MTRPKTGYGQQMPLHQWPYTAGYLMPGYNQAWMYGYIPVIRPIDKKVISFNEFPYGKPKRWSVRPQIESPTYTPIPATTTQTSFTKAEYTTNPTSTTQISSTMSAPTSPAIPLKHPSDAENINIKITNKTSEVTNEVDLGYCGIQDISLACGQDETVCLKEFPWLAVLMVQSINGLKMVCTGALIHPQYVVAGAHCVTGSEQL
jgi:hypothetical protein